MCSEVMANTAVCVKQRHTINRATAGPRHRALQMYSRMEVDERIAREPLSPRYVDHPLYRSRLRVNLVGIGVAERAFGEAHAENPYASAAKRGHVGGCVSWPQNHVRLTHSSDATAFFALVECDHMACVVL